MNANVIFSGQGRVGLLRFFGTAEQNRLVCLALTNFGYLIKNPEFTPRFYSYEDLAQKIKETAKITPDTKAVYDNLKGLHQQVLAELAANAAAQSSPVRKVA